EIIELQRRVVAVTGGVPGVRDPERLARVLAKPFTTRNGLPMYRTLFQRIAVLMQGILFERPFHEANRRTALVVASVLLHRSGYRLHTTTADYVRFIKGIELGITS